MPFIIPPEGFDTTTIPNMCVTGTASRVRAMQAGV